MHIEAHVTLTDTETNESTLKISVAVQSSTGQRSVRHTLVPKHWALSNLELALKRATDEVIQSAKREDT